MESSCKEFFVWCCCNSFFWFVWSIVWVLGIINVPVTCPSGVEIKFVVSVDCVSSCGVLVKNVPSVFSLWVFKKFDSYSALFVVGVVPCLWGEAILVILEGVKFE